MKIVFPRVFFFLSKRERPRKRKQAWGIGITSLHFTTNQNPLKVWRHKKKRKAFGKIPI
jgi:hypothetical protein